MINKLINYQKEIEVKYEYDIAIIGGGISGVCAALRASDDGANVILIEQYAALGGNATIAGVAAFCGNTKGQGEIFDEIIRELEHYNAIGDANENFYLPRVFDHEILAVVLEEMVLKRNIKLILHANLIDVISSGRQIDYALISGKSGICAIKAKIFIDCSGDGDIAYYSNCEYQKGRKSDGLQLPMSLMCFVRHIEEKDVEKRKIPNDRFNKIRSKSDLPMTTIWPNGPRSNALKIKIPLFDSTNTESLTNAEIFAHKRMMEVISYYQNVENKPFMLDHYPTQIGIREGRRILGDYVLTISDLREGKEFYDGVAVGTFYLDGHKPDDDKRTYILTHDEMNVPPYQIPFRSLIAKDKDNLLMAGRCFSCEQMVLSSARVMTTCAMMGQAVGLAGALCIKLKKSPRELDYKKLKEKLSNYGADFNVKALLELQKNFKLF